MAPAGAPSRWARARPGLWAGATVGFLTAICYIFFFGGLDFSRGNPLRPLLELPGRMLVLAAVLTILGAIAGAVVSFVTPDATDEDSP